MSGRTRLALVLGTVWIAAATYLWPLEQYETYELLTRNYSETEKAWASLRKSHTWTCLPGTIAEQSRSTGLELTDEYFMGATVFVPDSDSMVSLRCHTPGGVLTYLARIIGYPLAGLAVLAVALWVWRGFRKPIAS